MTRTAPFPDQLRAYAPSDGAEAAHQAEMVSLLTNAGEPFSRSHFEPGHFTASYYIIDDAGRILLHHHRRLDRWLQMGGYVETGESPDRAALREAVEESGLADVELASDGIFDLDIHPIPAGKGEPDHRHYDVRYLARTATPQAIAMDRAESNALAWVTLDRAAELMHGPESHRVLRKIAHWLRERSDR
jgi:8-oxo-dGTP pyrophosphatase MutT (NUDIX family)